MEKKKLRANYGLTEKQLRGLMSEARQVKGDAGKKLIELLERRLDNAVFRAGFAPTIPAARQLVNHGHVRVNGKKVDISSLKLRRGDVISLSEQARKNAHVQASLQASTSQQDASWLEINRDTAEAKLTTLPDETSLLFPLQIQLVVEFYAQSM